MKIGKLPIIIAIVVVLIATLACQRLSATIATITNAYMARGVQDSDKTNTFSPSDKVFYCFFDLNYAPNGTKVKGMWIAVQAEGLEPDFLIATSEFTQSESDGPIYFSLERSHSVEAWPVGKYKIDLYINDKLVQTIEFEVQ